MKSCEKIEILIFLILVISCVSSILINNRFNFIKEIVRKEVKYNKEINFDNQKLKVLKISERIHIINNSGWVDYKNTRNCTGKGTYLDPYIIEDLVIDGGCLGSCIWIENSDVYFKIDNCTLYNSGYHVHAGIRLSNTKNSQIIKSNCINNDYYGIYLESSDNNFVIGNNVNNNWDYGIYLTSSDNNIVSENIVNDNWQCGIYLSSCSDNTITENSANNNQLGIYLSNCNNTNLSGNIMNECGLGISGSFEELCSYNIDITNLVNGKPLYYYTNEIHLEPNNFTNAGQVILINCTDSLISNLNISYSSIGILLYYCNNNTISGNGVNNNKIGGIELWYGNNNKILKNLLNNSNLFGIKLIRSNINSISGNIVTRIGRKLYECDGGIYLEDSDYNIVSENSVINSILFGIQLIRSNYNSISGNKVANISSGGLRTHSYGIYLRNSSTNMVSENKVINTEIGIRIAFSYKSIISENNINNNIDGIWLTSSFNNDIIKNDVNRNYRTGILVSESIRNKLYENTIYSNDYGIYILESNSNTIYFNCFYDNNINAFDDGFNNSWDNGISGNYWDDYYGYDFNRDGIGDIPYHIPGSAGSKDKFPLIKCPFSQLIIPGYNIFIIIISILFLMSVVVKKKLIISLKL